jgi:gluconate 5-dehydrogenase
MSDGEHPHRHLRVVRGPDVSPEDHLQPSHPRATTYRAGSFRSLLNLDERVALIVGGGGVTGGSIAHALADHGARVVIADLDVDAARAVAKSCARPNTEGSLAVQIDVTNPKLFKQVVAAIEHETHRIDILVYAVGIAYRKPLIDFTPEEWAKTLDINLSGAFRMTQAVAGGMLERRYGRIITIGSAAGLLRQPHNDPSAAMSSGIATMKGDLAAEWATKGITVNAIAPAFSVTESNLDHIGDPVPRDDLLDTIGTGRCSQPEAIAGAAVYLCSDAAGFVSGQTIYVGGGRSAH